MPLRLSVAKFLEYSLTSPARGTKIQVIMIRIEAAIARAKEQGKKITKGDLATLLWPDASAASQRVNISRLCSGKNDRVAPEWIRIISKTCGVTADFLFGLSND